MAAYEKWLVPSGEHVLGTDQFGRDVLAMVMKALSVSLQIGAIAGVISTVVGVIVAFVAGYKGGWIDNILSTFTGILLVIPTFPLLIALSAYAKNVEPLPGRRDDLDLLLAVRGQDHPFPGAEPAIASVRRSGPGQQVARSPRSSPPNCCRTCCRSSGSASPRRRSARSSALVGLEVIGLGPGGVIDLGQIIFNAINTGALTLGAWPMFVVPIVLLTCAVRGAEHDQHRPRRGLQPTAERSGR